MFVIGDTLVTPPLSDSILDGVTRNSLLILAKDLGYKTEERQVSIEELKNAFKNKTITEAFGAALQHWLLLSQQLTFRVQIFICLLTMQVILCFK